MNLLMNRNVMKVLFLAVVAVAGWVGLSTLQGRWSQNGEITDLKKQVQEERDRRAAAEAIVRHLQSENRVADVLVTDVSQSEGTTYTTLLFQEYAKDGSPLPPKRFTIRGNEAHIDAMVVKFKGKFVEANDFLRGRSVALFTKLFDNKQAPENGYVIDEPGHIPAIYRGADPKVSEFEQKLWSDFWKLAGDRNYRDQMGVELVQGKAVWYRFEPGFLYTLTMQADGDLNLRSEQIRPSIRELMKLKQSGPTTVPVN